MILIIMFQLCIFLDNSVKYVLRIYLNLLINSFRLFWWINHCPSLFIWNGIFSFLEFWSRLHVYPTAVSILINSSLRCIMHDQISNLCSTLKNHPRIIKLDFQSFRIHVRTTEYREWPFSNNLMQTILRLNPEILKIIEFSEWNLNLKFSDSTASKIIYNHIKLEPISLELNIENHF